MMAAIGEPSVRVPDAVRALRSFHVTVARTVRLSTHFLRITFTGDDLDHFGDDGQGRTLDLRIKCMIPSGGKPLPDLRVLQGDWYQAWLALDPDSRGSMRTYTVRALRHAGSNDGARVRSELDVDFVLHPEAAAGPAARWAAAALPGDPMVLIGPDRRAGSCAGIEFSPGGAGRLLLVGDETAVPAIGAILEALPEDVQGHALLEVPTRSDILDLRTRSAVAIHWLPRGRHAHGELVTARVRRVLGPAACNRGEEPEEVDVDAVLLWETPATLDPGHGFYAWIAGEAGMVRELRRYLIRDVGVDRKDVAFMGYWRLGRAS